MNILKKFARLVIGKVIANPVPDVKEHILEKSTIAISLLNLYPLSNKNDLFLSNHTKGK